MQFYFVISSFMRIFADNLGHCALLFLDSKDF